MATTSHNYKVHCSVDEPIQRLMEKLSAKSPQLYIFWQNYNQLYAQYADRVAEIENLRIELERFRAESDRLRADCDRLRAIQAEHRCPVPQPIQQYPPPQPVIIQKSLPAANNDYELASLKEKVWTLQRQSSDLKHECEHWRQQADELALSNETLVEQNRNFQLLLKQFKTENAVQKENIDHIVARLREAEIDLQGSRSSRVNQDQLSEQLQRSKQIEESLRKALQEKQSELQMLMISVDEIKTTYERMLADAVRSIKGKMIESLPSLIEQARTTKHLRYTAQVIHR